MLCTFHEEQHLLKSELYRSMSMLCSYFIIIPCTVLNALLVAAVPLQTAVPHLSVCRKKSAIKPAKISYYQLLSQHFY